MHPSRTVRLQEEDGALVCACRVKFPIKDGFPVLIAEEADLPDGCNSLDDLPCRREGK